ERARRRQRTSLQPQCRIFRSRGRARRSTRSLSHSAAATEIVAIASPHESHGVIECVSEVAKPSSIIPIHTPPPLPAPLRRGNGGSGPQPSAHRHVVLSTDAVIGSPLARVAAANASGQSPPPIGPGCKEDGTMTEIARFEAMYSARALRRFKSDPVPEQVLTKVLDAAIRAPSAGNAQSWSFVVVR